MSWIADSTTGIRSKREEGKKQKKKEKQVFLLLTIGFKWRCVYLGVCFFFVVALGFGFSSTCPTERHMCVEMFNFTVVFPLFAASFLVFATQVFHLIAII